MQKISYEAEMQRRGLGKMGLFDTQGGKVLQGIGSTIEGFGQSLADVGFGRGGVDSLQRLGLMAAQNFNQPSDQFIAEQERLRDNISGVTGGNFGEEKPSMGNVRPEGIQSQIDIFENVPGGDPLTVDQINELYRKDAKGGEFKPFPTDQARQVKDQNLANKFGSGAADTATAQNLAVGFKKEKAKEQIKADANREASLDMPNMSDDPTEQLFAQAMSEFIKDARTGTEDDLPEVGDIKAYKKKFAEATGVDISGKPDTSQALMAMGLSMMQNRAGKGFNVGKILNAVGKAGEKALPLLSKAKTEARNNVIAAGKYALQTEATDEKTRKAAEKELMSRGKYWVFSKGGKDGEFSNFEKGEFVDLNKAEMNKLITDPKFDEKYSFVNANTRFDILAKRAEGQELGAMWSTKGVKDVSLIGGSAKDVPAELQVAGTYANPNYKGTPDSKILLAEKPQAVIDRFLSYQDSIDRSVSKFTNLVDQIDQGVSIPGQAVDKVTGVFRSLGFNVEGLPSNTAEAKRILNNIAIDEATNILKESGKTLSDGDRRLVKERVGQIDFFNADKVLIKRQVQEVYDLIVTKSQKNLDIAVGKLESDFGIVVRPPTQSGPKDQAELDEFNKTYNTNFTMETFPKD